MDFNRIYSIICNQYSGVNFSLKKADENLEFTASLNIKPYDDDIFFKAIAYDTGTVHVFFTFDKLDMNESNLRLVNSFSSGQSWFIGMIEELNGNYYFKAHFNRVGSGAGNEQDIANTIMFAINQLMSDGVKKVLMPISDRTY